MTIVDLRDKKESLENISVAKTGNTVTITLTDSKGKEHTAEFTDNDTTYKGSSNILVNKDTGVISLNGGALTGVTNVAEGVKLNFSNSKAVTIPKANDTKPVELVGGTYNIEGQEIGGEYIDSTPYNLFTTREGDNVKTYDFSGFRDTFVGILRLVNKQSKIDQIIEGFEQLKQNVSTLMGRRVVAGNQGIRVNESLDGSIEVSGYSISETGLVTTPDYETYQLPIPTSTDNKTYDLTIENTRVNTPNNSNAQYRRLSHNSFTKLGILHLDFTPTANLGTNAIITRLPASAPKPTTLIEVMATGMNNGNGTVWINTNGVVYSNGLTQGNRYILNLIGYFE